MTFIFPLKETSAAVYAFTYIRYSTEHTIICDSEESAREAARAYVQQVASDYHVTVKDPDNMVRYWESLTGGREKIFIEKVPVYSADMGSQQEG